MHIGSSVATSCCLDHVSITRELWFKECTLRVRLWRHKTVGVNMVRNNVPSTAWALLAWSLILSVLIEVKRFTNSVRYMLSGLRHPIVRMALGWDSEVWTVWSLNLKLLVNTWVVLGVRHASLPWPSSSCSYIPLLLILLCLISFIVQVLCTFTWWWWLKEKVVLQFLSLVSWLLRAGGWSIFNGRVVSSSLLRIFRLMVALDFLACVVSTLISQQVW